MPRVHVIIPARYASSRFPGKPLADIAGKPMIQHVFERANASEMVDGVTVATDDKRVFEVVKGFGGNVQMTSVDHNSGSSRAAEVARSLSADIIVNLQGDEPLMRPEEIERVIAPLINNPDLSVTSLMTNFKTVEEYLNPGAVKVICDMQGNAIFFSRYPVPFDSGFWTPGPKPTMEHWLTFIGKLQKSVDVEKLVAQRHIGVYAFRRDLLLQFAKWEQSASEKAESLEQLRLLERGEKIRMVSSKHESRGVDTPEDLEEVRRLVESL